MTQEITQHADPQRRDLEERRASAMALAHTSMYRAATHSQSGRGLVEGEGRGPRGAQRSQERAARRARAQLRALGDAAAVRSTMDVAATADPEPHQTLRYLLAAIPADVRAEIIDNARRRADDAGVAAAEAAARAHRMSELAGKPCCRCCPGSIVVVPRPRPGRPA